MSVFGRHSLAGLNPRAFICFSLGLMLLLPGTAPRADVSDLAVIEYVFVGQSRAGRTDFDYTYRITIRNDGEALANVRALATSTSPNTTVLNGEVEAGAIAAGGVVTPEDTFTFRQNRRYVFNPSSIVWTFSADAVEPVNTPPVADAGHDQVLQSGVWVQLDGSASTDADGDPLSYTWQLTQLPAGSTATLDDPASVMPGFLADRPGAYVGRLVVNDGQADSAPDFVTVSSENTPPVADAGLDQTVPVGGAAQLFGSGSFDANGDALTYMWRLASRPPESTAALDSTSEENTSFVVDVAGEYTVELVVNDGYVDSAPDTALVTTSNSPPVADAGDDQEVEVGDVVNLDGSFSFDVDDDPLDYVWSLLSTPPGSAAEVASPPGPTGQFLADTVGLYVAQLIVNDGMVNSAPDTAVVTAVAGNQPPLAVAAASPLQPGLGELVQLDGSGSSDPDDDDLTYLWALARPAGSSATLSSVTDVAPSFVADVEGSYTASLVVNDGELDSAPTAVIVTVSTDNNPPALVAVGDRVTFVGGSLEFRIFAIDPDVGDTLTFALPTAPAGASIDLFSGDFVYTAPASPALETVTVRVTDAGGLSDTTTFTIDVRSAPITPPENAPPTLAPIGPRTIQVGQALSIQTDASDPDAGDTLSYTLPAAPAGISISSSGLIEWTPAADQVGAHDVTVQVTDTAGAAALQSAIVTVVALNRPPVAVDDLYDARIGETTSIAAPGVLDNDSDPDGDALSALLVTTTSNGVLDFRPDGSFDYTPGLPETTGPVELELKCEAPPQYTTNGTVAVGDVDNDGETEIIGVGAISSGTLRDLWILDADCVPKAVPNLAAMIAAGGFTGGHLGLLDIDGDGDLEIIGVRAIVPGVGFDGDHLLAVHHDGSLAWPGDGASETMSVDGTIGNSSDGAFSQMGPTFADINGNGSIEIIMPWYRSAGIGGGVIQGGVTVFNSADGTILWEFLAGAQQFGDSDYKPPVVVDLDLDGTMEIIYHTNVIDHTGALEFLLPVQLTGGWSSHLTTAVANFDDDPYPEIIAIDQRNHYLFNHDGTLIFQNPVPNNSQSQITVADFDGDGEVEYAWYAGLGSTLTRGYFQVYDTNGSLLWSHQGLDQFGEELTRFKGVNATAFDANGDGAADLVVHLDVYTPVTEDVDGVYIFDGRDGSLLEFAQIGSNAAEQRFTTIVDLDDDGAAEIISSRTSGLVNQTRVWRGTEANPLPPAPNVRNQWIFDQTRIDDAANVLTDPEPAWLQPGRNGYNMVADPQRVYTQTKCELPFPPSGFGTNGTMAVGDVDGDGQIELVGITPLSAGTAGDFFVVNANDCSVELGSTPLTGAVGGLRPGTHVGLLDIDGDGDLELIGRRLRVPGGGFDSSPALIAVHHDGTLAWPGDGGTQASGRNFATNQSTHVGPQFADLDGDGTVEILMSWAIGCAGLTCTSGVTVYNSADGSVKWEYQGEPQRASAYNKPVTIVDLDLDGTMEVILHTHVISHTGELEFRLPVTAPFATQPLVATHLHTAVANFDDDPYPEIIARDTNRTYLFEHDGTLKWAIERDTSSLSPITVADFDGDGQVEYAYLGGDYSIFSGGLPRYLEVYDTDGTPLWSHADRDRFKEAGGTASPGQAVVAYDANDDGAYDLVVYLRVPDRAGMYIFSGRDGSLLEFIPINYYQNYQRFPVVADIDGDGHAELISSFDGGLTANILVVEGTEAKPLPPAPPVRNQWHYHEAYVNDDASIPANPMPHWLRPELNGWHMISRAPDPLAGTTDSFTYRASDGQATSNLATVSFDVQPAGTPPVFLSEPDTLTTVGFPYQYAARVVDLDPGDVVTLSLAAAPPGMTLSSTGRLNWTPDAVGEYGVSILASDTIGFTTVQSFTLAVGEPVTVPDVVGSPRSAAEDTLEDVNLLVGTVREATHPTVPAGTVAEQSPPGGAVAEFGGEVDLVVSRGPGPEDLDGDGDGATPNQGDCDDSDASIYPGAPDDPGDGIDSNCNGIDGDMPVASIMVSPASSTVLVGQSVSLTATGVFDDGTAQNLTGVVTWTNGPNFVSATPGAFTATATRDGVSGSATIEVVARIGDDQVPPTVSISAPAADSTVTEPVDVTGTATDSNFLKYELAYAPAGESRFTPIVVSTTPVTGGVLGRFDPTLLVNDLYNLRLTVFDRGGNQTVDEITVQVDGDMKVGHFTLAFTDLAIPMAGIPVTVTRRYDTRDKQSGDFGYGWKLDVDTLRLRTNRTPGTGWQVVRSGLAFGLIATSEHKLSLTLPGGKVEEFDLVITPQVSPLVPFPVSVLRARFQPRPGTRGAMESLDNTTLSILDPQPGPVTLVEDTGLATFDPQRFRYTSPEGVQIVIHKRDGVESIRDTNGNTVTFTEAGIRHSAGLSVDFTRDALGRITAITDPAGVTQTYSYDGNGDLTVHTDEEGFATRFWYDSSHSMIRMVDPLQRQVVRNDYDENGRLLSSTDGEGNPVTFNHDMAGRSESIVDRRGGISTFVYDDSGNVTSITDAAGEIWTFAYDSRGRETSRTNPLNETFLQEYDDLDNLISTTSPLGEVHRFVRDSAGRVIEEIDASGRSTTFQYDSRGNKVVETDAAGNSVLFTYDSMGNLTTITDRSGDVERVRYNSLGQIVGVDRSDGQSIEYTLNALGVVTSERHRADTPDGEEVVELSYRHDARGNLVEFNSPVASAPLQMSWNAGGELSGSVDPLGNSVAMLRDLTGRIVRTEWSSGPPLQLTLDGEGAETTAVLPGGMTLSRTVDSRGDEVAVAIEGWGSTSLQRDAVGRVARRTDPGLGAVDNVYDAAGRLTASQYPGGIQVSRTFDAAGRPTTATDPLGNTTTMQYDSRGFLSLIQEADGRQYERAYNEDGLLSSKRDTLGVVWDYEYAAGDRLSAATDPLGHRTSYAYDLNGEVKEVVTPAGDRYRYVFDDAGRLLRATLPNGISAGCSYDALARPLVCSDFDGSQSTFAYDDTTLSHAVTRPDGTETRYLDSAGQLVRVNVGGQDYTLVRDIAGRLTSWSSPNGLQVLSAFGANGQRSATSTQSGASTGYSYDNRGFVTGISDISGAIAIARDAGGRTGRITFANGAEITKTYDEVGRAVDIGYTSAAGAEVIAMQYSLDGLGRVSALSEAGGRLSTYAYDDLGRLEREEVSSSVSSTVTTYEYDSNNNLRGATEDGSTRAFVTDRTDMLLSDSLASYLWDARGNMIGRSSASGLETYTYDSQDRLIRYARTGATSTVVEYGYAYDGLLESRTEGGQTRRFNWDRSAQLPLLIEITNSSGQAQARYIYDGLFPIAEVTASGETYHHVRDRLGTLRARIAEDGTVVESLDYDAFGRQSLGQASPVGYTGAYHDSATGLAFMRSRWYSPDLRRFLTRDAAPFDPLDPRSINRYSYSYNDPVNRFDPSGQVTVAEVVVNLAIANAIALAGYSVIVDGFRALTSALGLFEIPRYFGTKVNARFISLTDLTGTPPKIPAVGGASVGLGPFSVSLGYEAVKFTSPAMNALYITAGSGLGANFFGGKVESSTDAGKPKFGVPGSSFGSWISHTPTPADYQGPFIAAQLAAVRPELAIDTKGGVTSVVASRLRGVGGQFFWSPTVTYSERGNDFRSHGVSKGLRNGAVGISLALNFTWYGLAREWPYGAE